MGIKGDRRHVLHPTAASGCVGAAPWGQGHAPGVTPWPAPASAVGARSEKGIGVSGQGRKTTLWTRAADAWGPAAVTASEGGEARGRERRAGWLLGLRELVGWPAAALAGLAGFLLGREAEQAWAFEAFSSSLFFSIFPFISIV